MTITACDTKCETVIKLDQEVADLKGWQKSQNGAIHRVEKKVDSLQFWIMTSAVGVFFMIIIQILLMLLKKGI